MDDHLAHRHWAGFLLMACAIGAMTWTGLALIGAWFLTVHLLLALVCLTYLWIDRRWTQPHLKRRDHKAIQATVAFTTKTLLVGVFLVGAQVIPQLLGAELT